MAQHLVSGLRDIDPPGFELILWGRADLIGEVPDWCRIAATDTNGAEWRGQGGLRSTPPHTGGVFLHQVRPLRDWNTVSVIYDTIQIRMTSPRRRPAVTAFLRRVARRSAVVLTISDHSRDCIARELGRPAEQIGRIDLPLDTALAERVRARRDAMSAADPAWLPSDVLYVGRLDVHKNIPGLIEAFAQSGLADGRQLRLFGPAVDESEPLRRVAAEHDLADGALDVAADRSDEQLIDAYANAAMLVLPSFEEGWGLPAAEAAACGIPVIATSYGSLPEVARLAHGPFHLVDVHAPGALTAALSEHVVDPDLATMRDDSLATVRSAPDAVGLADTVVRSIAQTRST